MSESKDSRGALALGGLAAILASTCCLGPLMLVGLGFSGAWIGNLTVLEPYRPLFIGAALVAMVFAYRRIFRPARACEPGEVCAVPRVRTTTRSFSGPSRRSSWSRWRSPTSCPCSTERKPP